MGDEQSIDRVAAVRSACGPRTKIRLDANGAWDVETALQQLARLAAYDIELVEDPVASLEELAATRGRCAMPIAAESCIRTTADARRMRQLGAADAIVLKPQRIGGVREALRAAEASGVPAIASSALETSVGLAAVVAVAAALPDAPYAHGVGTAMLLESDVVDDPLHPIDGWLTRPQASREPATARQHMTEPGEGDIALAYATTLLDELVAGGVTHMCMTPGSRSTPIALAAARHPGITLHVHVDERSSAFFGLGIAAASGKPVAMFCTSGTAAANHFPAVVEASMARVPIIVMTADRPPELHGVGANQTINQQNLFGGFVKWFHDTGVPVMAPHERIRWMTAGMGAIQHAVGMPPGPVHLNLPFREPLLPTGGNVEAIGGERTIEDVHRYASKERPVARVSA